MASSFSEAPKRPSFTGDITEVRTERTVYDWRIRNFKFFSQAPGEMIQSKSFLSGKSAEKWHLLFYPHGYSETDKDYVSLYIRRGTSVQRKIRIFYELMILQSNQVIKELSTTDEFDSMSDWGYPRFLKRSHLLNADSDSNEFTIRCIIEVPLKTVTSSFDPETSSSGIQKMEDDIGSLLKKPKYSDFTILAGEESFATHRNILATRSAVFAEMFEEKEEEGDLEEIEINNFSPRIVKAMLEFIYANKVSGIEDIANDLLVAADAYRIEGLKVECSKAICKNINKHNAADIVVLAEKHGAPQLKECALQYMVDNFLDVVESRIYQTSKLTTKLLREFIEALARREKTH